MRTPTPELASIPSPDGKYPNFGAYIDHCVSLVGTNRALGLMLGFTTGTRVSDWRNALGGRPSFVSCMKLAELTGDDPISILIMGGLQEEADLLRKWADGKFQRSVSDFDVLRPLEQIDGALSALLLAKKRLEAR